MASCPQCGHEPPAGSPFCNGCGAKLVIVCASCGATPPPGSRFCNGCGAPLAPADQPSAPRAAAAPEERKVISILFVDLMGSTALQERLDPESVNRVMDAYYRAVRSPVEAAGGTVVQLLGDGVLCAFGIPRVAEDDALRAVRAAVEIQQAFQTFVQTQQWLKVPIGLRVAINTGEVVVSDEHPAGIGDPLNVAARLQQEARDGEVLIGQATRRLVAAAVTLERAGVFNLKGRADTVTAYRVVSLERPSGATTAAFVGRDDELARISAVYDAAIAEPAARLAVVLGSPGLGKSRLIDEVALRLGDGATVITAQCDAAGGATFAPIARAVRAFRRVEGDAGTSALAALIASEPDRERIAAGMAALLEGKAASPEETFFVIRRFLTALAGSKPVVLVIDDLHWAEPLLLDLVEHLVQWGSGVRLLVLVGARPELRDLRSGLVTPGGLVAEVVALSGLDASAAMRLAANAIGAADLPSAVAAKVLATSEGNPLFVGELVRMLVDEGALERAGDRWIIGANLASIEMPPTIHALLAARIERLRPEERAVLEHAAVVGRHFSRSAVAALLGGNGSTLDARLEALRRTELIEPDVGWFLGEPVLRFHHVLIRDAAYRRLLKGTRAALHQRLADWIEAQVADAPEHDETIGWHLEQAHQHLRELGPLDEAGRSLGERAAQRLAAAGRRALAGDDVALAASLLGRAIERLDGEDPSRAELALDWCEALLSAGDVGPAAKAINELARFAEPDALRLRAWHTCFTGQLTALTAPQKLQATSDEVAAAADELAKLGDAAGEAKAHSVHAQALARLGKVGACEAALDRALAAARKAGDRRRANAVLAGAPVAALGGPSPVTRASGRCLDVVRVLRITQGAPAVEAVALSCQGVLEALRGRTDAARRMIASSRKMVEELGIAHRLFEADVFAGRIDLLEGDAVSAERTLRGAYEGLRDLGLAIDAARAGALLARAQLAQGRIAEAETLSRESEALAGDDLQAAIAWRGVRAEAFAQRGETTAAVELAEAAVAIASATDALLDHADARLALAAALRSAGRDREADAEERRAVELWQAKGATLLAERASGPVERARPEAPPAPVVQRRVAPNAASAAIARHDAAFNAGDLDGIAVLYASDAESIDHMNEVTYGREGTLDSVRWMLRAREPRARFEIIATLGESLGLSRNHFSTGGNSGRVFDVGDYEREEFAFTEVDERGQCRRVEMYAPSRLRDAIVRLYERYGELLPAGPERDRADAIARSVAVWNGPIDPERLATAMDPSVDCIDHRTFHTWNMRGREQSLAHWHEQISLASGFAVRDDDILALATDAVLVRQTFSGNVRATGGAFENVILVLLVFGTSGRLAHSEVWEPDCQAEALARFDELSAKPGPAAARRRVRANTATRSVERFEAELAARDEQALAQRFDTSLSVVHHPTSLGYGRREMLATWRSLVRARHLEFRQETLASLGDSLVLGWHLLAFEGFQEAHLAEVGLSDLEEITLIEVDDRGRWIHVELFAPDRLGDALGRLYECYAEQLPEGQARARAAGIARSLSACNGPIDLDTVAATYDPSFRDIDHRVLKTWSAGSAEEMLRHFRVQLDLAPDFAARYDDVLALDVEALVVSMTFFGTARDSGGQFENKLCVLFRFGADGRQTETEVFEAEQVDEALARFDALGRAGEGARFEEIAASKGSDLFASRSKPTTATVAMQRAWAVFDSGDFDAARALCAPSFQWEDRRPLVGLTGDIELMVASARERLASGARHQRREILGTAGDRIAIGRVLWAGGPADGRFEVEFLTVHEVDEAGLCTAMIFLDPGDLGAAQREAASRRAAIERPDPLRIPPNAATRANDRWVERAEAGDWDALRSLVAAGTFEDRRPLLRTKGDLETMALENTKYAWGGRGTRAQRTLLATAGDRLALERVLWTSKEAAAAFEVELLQLTEVNEDGLVVGYWFFDPSDRVAASKELFERYATTGADGVSAVALEGVRAWNEHDLARLRAVLPANFYLDDRRRTGVGRLDGAAAYLDSLAALWALSRDLRIDTLYFDRISTHGYLYVTRWSGTNAEGGEFDAVYVCLGLARGDRPIGLEIFELEDFDVARARFAELARSE